MGPETFSETPDTAFGTCKETKGECLKFDFPCTWGKFEPKSVIFQKSARTIRLYADDLGVRRCPILCVRVLTGIRSRTPMSACVCRGAESSPPQAPPA